ncbi:hypothetical protein ACSFA0_13920 [Variovorax sp. LT1P1]|uniref:hypothetical protein n=1 Tax=Variovorax sp. LT1P1 TaxID=3443730 RepID=UPI003F463DC5
MLQHAFLLNGTYRLAMAGTLAVLLGACATPVPPSASPKAIVSVAWTTADFATPIHQAFACQPVGILVTTRGYQPGEAMTLKIGETHDAGFQRTLHGTVDADGKARLSWQNDTCDAMDAPNGVPPNPADEEKR